MLLRVTRDRSIKLEKVGSQRRHIQQLHPLHTFTPNKMSGEKIAPNRSSPPIIRTRKEIFQENFGRQVRTKDTWGQPWWMPTDQELSWRRPQHGRPLSDFTKLTLPYFAPDGPEIPSIQQIATAMRANPLYNHRSYRYICKIGSMVVKMDNDYTLVQEAEDLLWLRENTSVRVPKVYSVFSDRPWFGSQSQNKMPFGHQQGEIPYFYLVMEFLEGETIDHTRWVALSEAQQETIHFKLGEQYRLLRSVPSEGYYGRVKSQGYYPQTVIVQTDYKTIVGPYQTFKDLASDMYRAAEVATAFNWSSGDGSHDSEELPDKHKAWLSAIWSFLADAPNCEPKLTHTDPGLSNTLIRPLDADSLEKASDFEVTLIDWNGLGWFPAYMQRLMLDEGPSWYNFKTKEWDSEQPRRFRERLDSYFEEKYRVQFDLVFKTKPEEFAYRLC
jgi:hypothetical protein